MGSFSGRGGLPGVDGNCRRGPRGSGEDGLGEVPGQERLRSELMACRELLLVLQTKGIKRKVCVHRLIRKNHQNGLEMVFAFLIAVVLASGELEGVII